MIFTADPHVVHARRMRHIRLEAGTGRAGAGLHYCHSSRMPERIPRVNRSAGVTWKELPGTVNGLRATANGKHSSVIGARSVSEFGDELQRLMAERGIGVRELARQVPCNAGHISQLRHGQKRASPQTAKRLDEVLDAGGTLIALTASSSSRRASGFAGASDSVDVPVPVDHAMRIHVRGFSPVQLDELIGHLDDQWHSLVKTDNLLGPRHAMGAVHAQLNVIEALLRSARPPARQLVLRLGAKYAESTAWLHEDCGDMAGARYWTGRSMEWAVEGDDRLMVSWTLFRRGQHAAAARDAAQVAGLAAAARREAGGAATGPMLASILQQEAHAHALDGSEAECHNSLDRAHRLAAAPDDPGDASNGHGSFCTAAYLEMQRGACWLMLGDPAKAIGALKTAIRSLPPAYRRDRGVAFSHHAAALAAAGELAEAATVAVQALDIARDSGSERIARMVAGTAAVLAPHSEVEAVAGLRAALAETPAA
jgi:transcriptional regulator with XRE-family HTH domain/tetratricopeptide (TPR) repeat protein